MRSLSDKSLRGPVIAQVLLLENSLLQYQYITLLSRHERHIYSRTAVVISYYCTVDMWRAGTLCALSVHCGLSCGC